MKVEYLNRFTPSEILLLRDGYDVELKDIFKYTLLDLIYKKVIHYELLQHFEVKTKYFICFSKGEQYNIYVPHIHETSFISVLDNKEKLLLHEYIRDYLHKYNSPKKIKNQIIESKSQYFFDRNLIDGIFNRYKRNEAATIQFQKIKDEIQLLELRLNDDDVSTVEKVTLVKSLNGNILFLNKKENPILNDIEKEIQHQLYKDSNSNLDLDFIDLDFSFNSFDSVFSNIDFDGFGGGDFGGGGADGSWDISDLDFDLDFS